jgi:hypothetical protein
MRKAIYAISACVLLVAGWYFLWTQMMTADVARVKASIDHHYQRIKTAERYVTLKADDVYATGFPFGFRVAVARPTLSQVWGTQSYAVSFEKIELESTGGDDGRYRVIAPSTFDAMYAEDGKAPEKYRVSVNAMPGLLLRAGGNSRECPNLPGAKRCEPVAEDAPLNAYAVQLPSNLVLDVSLYGRTQKIGFNFMPINLPIFQTIPDRMSGPLTLFVGMLREALVFQGA